MIASLIGCSNVITHRIAEKQGVKIENLDIIADAKFDKSGASIIEEIEVPFPEVNLNINIKCDANEDQFNKIKEQLKMYCPISKVIANSGTKITENWNKV